MLKAWFDTEADDDFIWKVCRTATLLLDDDDEQLCGWDELPPPALYPRKHREILRAIAAVRLGIGARKVSLKALDSAYSIAFPKSTPLNVSKKRRS